MARTATTPTVAPAAPVKTETKMQRAAKIYDEIIALGADKLDGKTPRRLFMDRCVAELQMGEKGANTYFQNLKNEKNGEGRYKYAPASQAAGANATPAPTAEPGSSADMAQELKQLRTQVTTLNRTVKQVLKAVAAPAHA